MKDMNTDKSAFMKVPDIGLKQTIVESIVTVTMTVM